MRFSPLLLLAALGGCTMVPPAHVAQTPQVDPLHAESFGAVDSPASVRTLVIVVHDDGAPGTRGNERLFAQNAVRVIPNAVAYTILRPGHADAAGNRSPGDPGRGNGDAYTTDRLALLTLQIRSIAARFPHANVILVGDGGGAAMVADLAGLQPDIASAIVLVGCPCALPEWRTHMASRTGDPAWKDSVASLDPLKTAGGVATTLRVAVLVGANDPVTPVKLSRAYVEALTLRGIATDYRIVPGGGHDLLGNPDAAMNALTHLAARLPEKP